MFSIKSIFVLVLTLCLCSSNVLAQTNPTLHLSLVNNARAAVGAPAMVLCPCLTASSQAQSNYQASINTMTHTSPYGGLFQRVTPFGASGTAIAENVAYGYANDNAVFNGWMASAGHKANILNPTYTRFGVSVATGSNGQKYWTQQFLKGTCNR
ncbi:hypothetical protein CYY_006709 [Polysphondylium violaceum]|uniref:SCP domain-containing protein n=1 Tax=Polysphondylium violaceum TaxID=133409 RepID=A0A8J4V2V6_9MYCE|nr:hypothetical protein CYY_006709 [Polysphondylium violaceum]